MKKCTCGFETTVQEYNICPKCSNKLETDKGKRTYTMGLSAEDFHTENIEMTYEEAKIVSRVLEELNKNAKGYCGSCWIEDVG